MHIKILLFCGCLIWTATALDGGRKTSKKKAVKRKYPLINDETFGREALVATTQAPFNLQIPKPVLETDDSAESERKSEPKPLRSNSKQTIFPTDNEIAEAMVLEQRGNKKLNNNLQGNQAAGALYTNNNNNNNNNNKKKRVQIKHRRQRPSVLRKGNRQRIQVNSQHNNNNNSTKKKKNKIQHQKKQQNMRRPNKTKQRKNVNKMTEQVKGQKFGQASSPDNKAHPTQHNNQQSTQVEKQVE